MDFLLDFPSTDVAPKSVRRCPVPLGRRRTLYILIIRLLITIAASITDEAPLSPGARDFCYYESFEGYCADQEVILMVKALYGRMQFGRCVKTNFGFIGCFTSVMELFDRRCSGKQSCTVDVVEPTFDSIRPCNVELKSYLEAEYRCIRVPRVNAPGCDVTFSRDLDTVAITSGGVTGGVSGGDVPGDQCGSDRRPWQLRVDPGQRLNVSLFQFATFPSTSEGLDIILTDSTTSGPAHRDCHVVGQLIETQLRRRLSLCSSTNDARETHVYISQTNLVDVILSPGNEDRFVLVFTVIGCSDLDSGPNVWVRYSSDRSTAEVGCRHGTSSWQLFCRGREWIGHHDNCSVPVASHSSTVLINPGSIFKMNSVLVTLIVVAVSATISICVLITGLFVFKKMNVQGLGRTSDEHRRHLLSLFTRRDPTLSDRPTLPPDDYLDATQSRHLPIDCPLYRHSSTRQGSYLWPTSVSPGHDRCPVDEAEHDLFVLKDNSINDGVDLFKGGLLFSPSSIDGSGAACPDCAAVGHPVRWDVDGLTTEECQDGV